MRNVAVLDFLVLAALVTLPEARSACPGPDEPCMNEHIHQKCQALVDKGCTNLIWMESCPIQFACGTYSDKKSSNDRQEQHGNLRVKNNASTSESDDDDDDDDVGLPGKSFSCVSVRRHYAFCRIQ